MKIRYTLVYNGLHPHDGFADTAHHVFDYPA